jgi:hypothetical protein
VPVPDLVVRLIYGSEPSSSSDFAGLENVDGFGRELAQVGAHAGCSAGGFEGLAEVLG